MLGLPQHIKRTCSVADFEAFEAATKKTVVGLATIPLKKGDLITFLEMDAKGQPTGREITRRITDINNSKQLNLPMTEVDQYGLEALSLEDPMLRTFKSMFDDSYFCLAMIVEKEEIEKWSLINQPVAMPLLICPVLPYDDILESLAISNWPVGTYSIQLRLKGELAPKKDDTTIVLTISDGFILTFGKSSAGEILGIELDITALAIGRTVDIYGNKIIPLSPAEVWEAFNLVEKVEEDNPLSNEGIAHLSDALPLATNSTEEQLQQTILNTLNSQNIDPQLFEDEEAGDGY